MSNEFIKPVVTIELAEYNALQKYIERLESNYYGDNPYKTALEDIIHFLFNGQQPDSFLTTKGGLASIQMIMSRNNLYVGPNPFNKDIKILLNQKTCGKTFQ